MKLFAALLFSLLFIFQAFPHEAKKQSENLTLEALTQKWLEYEGSEQDKSEKLFEEFSVEVEKAAPSDTIVYYFPEAKVIHENILEGIKAGDREKISDNVRSWEILQKNLVRFQLDQVYYSYRILILVIVLALLMSLIFLVLYLVTSKSHKENLAFTTQMIQTQEAERERISNELHDTVCQDLRVLQFQLKEEESITLCQKIASDVRNSCYALTPSDLNEGLYEALISLCDILKKQSGVEIIFFIQDEVRKDKNLNIYRIVQEVLGNAVKHSGAESVSLLVRTLDEKHFKIIVSDDGAGFDLKSALKKKKHFGLKNIQSRTEGLGGKVVFNSAPDEGCQVTVTIPY